MPAVCFAQARGQPGLHTPRAGHTRPGDKAALCAEQAACRRAEALTAGLQPLAVVGDKGCDADSLRQYWQGRGISVCIPPRRSRLVQHAYDEDLHRTRHVVENSFCRLKDLRRMSLRLDKTDTSFRAFAHLAAAILNWRLMKKLVRRT